MEDFRLAALRDERFLDHRADMLMVSGVGDENEGMNNKYESQSAVLIFWEPHLGWIKQSFHTH